MKKSNHVLPECYGDTYKEMLEDLACALSDKHKSRQLTAFWPMKGRLYEEQKGLMVVGRAVNGWSVKGRPQDGIGKGWTVEDLKNEQKRDHLIQGIRRLSEDLSSDGWKACDEKVNIRPKLKIAGESSGCPMSWVVEKAGSRNGGYNTNRSAFWRVSRKVLETLYSEKGSEEQWSSHLCWSNLYKVAPLETGNPLKSSKKVQRKYSVELLKMELKAYGPKCVLVLAGEDWYKPFIEDLEVDIRKRSENSLVEKVGLRNGQAWVFAKHPQGRHEVHLVSEVKNAFDFVA